METIRTRQLEEEIAVLRRCLKDVKERLEQSWERRDLAPDSELEAIERANVLLAESYREKKEWDYYHSK